MNQFQSSGIKQKSIINNTLNIKNIIEYIESNENEGILISLDQEKAFDRVEHNYLFKVLEKINFNGNFIKLIKIINKNIKSKILVNNKLTTEINIERSVRQGCPLSMLLYALSLEPLINAINKNNYIKGIKIPNLLDEIKSIQHADDTSVIIENEVSYKYVNREYKDYGKVSGSKINDQKTEVFLIGNAKERNLNEIPKEYIKDTIKVLGIKFGENEQKENFENLLNEIKIILDKWKNYSMNLIEKTIIIKTYAISKIN